MPMSDRANAVVNAFGVEDGVTPEQLRNLRRTIDASPALMAAINDVVERGGLARIATSSAPEISEYDPSHGVLRLPLMSLSTPSDGRLVCGQAAFLLGRYLQHVPNMPRMAQSVARFERDLARVADSKTRRPDYTSAVHSHLSDVRHLAADAEISGWNVMVDVLRKDAGERKVAPPMLRDIFQSCPHLAKTFIDEHRLAGALTYSMKENLAVSHADLRIDASPQNCEAVATNYFSGSGLEPERHANYNRHGARAINHAIRYELRASSARTEDMPSRVMCMDMAKLELNPDELCRVGVDLGTEIGPMPYLDTSRQPATYREWRRASAGQSLQPAVLPLHDPAHLGNGLYAQALDLVLRHDPRLLLRPYDGRGSDLAASLALAAHREGMTAINALIPNEQDGNTIYGVQLAPVPSRHTRGIDTSRGSVPAIHESSRQWQRMMERDVQGQDQQMRMPQFEPALRK